MNETMVHLKESKHYFCLKLLRMKNKQTILFYFIVIAFCVILKIICAPDINLSGFSAIVASAVFTGLSNKNLRNIFLLPLIVLFGTDLIIQVLYVSNLFSYPGFYNGQFINYILVLSVSILSVAFRNKGVIGIFISAVTGATFYFLASNFSVWLGDKFLSYTKDFAGLIQCYTAGLPFYRNSLISTIVFVPGFTILYQWMAHRKFTLNLKTTSN